MDSYPKDIQTMVLIRRFKAGFKSVLTLSGDQVKSVTDYNMNQFVKIQYPGWIIENVQVEK